MTLAHFYGMELYSSESSPKGMIRMEAFNYSGTRIAEKERLNYFVKAVKKIKTDFGRWDTPWGQVNRFQRLSGDIDLQFDDEKPSIPVGLTTARWGTLAAYGMRSKQETKKIYGTRGNSFVAVVEFGKKVKAKSLLAGGQSSNPNSAHFRDQAQPYADAHFKDVAYYREDVEKRSEKIYHPGEYTYSNGSLILL